jgi:hypothetical protein
LRHLRRRHGADLTQEEMYEATRIYRDFASSFTHKIAPHVKRRYILSNVFLAHRILSDVLGKSVPDDLKCVIKTPRIRTNFNLWWDFFLSQRSDDVFSDVIQSPLLHSSHLPKMNSDMVQVLPTELHVPELQTLPSMKRTMMTLTPDGTSVFTAQGQVCRFVCPTFRGWDEFSQGCISARLTVAGGANAAGPFDAPTEAYALTPNG